MLAPIFKFATNKDDVDFFCNCPNCKQIVGKIEYSFKYEEGVALFGYKTCKTCNESLDWTNIVNRFQIKSSSAYDLENNKTLGTAEPAPYKANMDKCMAILKSLIEGSKDYLAAPEIKNAEPSSYFVESVNTVDANDDILQEFEELEI